MTEKKPASPPTMNLDKLWQTALGSIDEIRETIIKGSQAGKAKLDATLLKRQRERLLVELAEAMLKDVERGALTLPAELADTAARVRDLDRQIEDHEREAGAFLKPEAEQHEQNR